MHPHDPTLSDVTFVIDGPLDQPTGGYLYDRLVIDGLRQRGGNVTMVNLVDAPGIGTALRENGRLALALARRPAGSVTIIDELCHPRALLAAALHRARPRGRLVALVHHLTASERKGLARIGRLALERPLIEAADRILVTSHTTREVLTRAGVEASRITAVLPGCDRLGMRAASPERAASGAVRLLFLGSVTPRKGVLELVRAFAAAHGEATLTLAGPLDRDLAYTARVREELERSPKRAAVRLTGALTGEALVAELNTHDVLVLPSHYEGFGIAIAEAVAHGLAVISTTAGAIPEVVRDGAEAILVTPGDERALAAAIARVTGDPGKLAAMQAAAIERAAALPRWSDTQREFAAALSG